MVDGQERSHEARAAAGGGGAATAAGMRFQQQLGSLFCSMVLAQRPIDDSFGLGQAIPVSVRFETEAPVDDILVETSENGYIAVQAKRSLTLSSRLDSPFGGTVLQFVRHWLACRDGSNVSWQRQLDAEKDRLVLAVSPKAPATVRIHLRDALRSLARGDGLRLPERTQRALHCFKSCVEQAWGSSTRESFDVAIVASLAELIAIYPFDDEGPGRARTRDILALSLPAGGNIIAARDAVDVACTDMMSKRTGVGLPELRRLLFAGGVGLRPRRDLEGDIARLRAHSRLVAVESERYERIDVAGEAPVQIARECQPVVDAAAKGGSLLITGEAGIGKSGVLNALGRQLESKGLDVIRLAVDEYSVASIEGLGNQLGLEHDLLEILGGWDAAEPGWLIVDALDAARGGSGEDVFRLLIKRALSLNGRWNVVATIRTYDLKQGLVFRSLFQGKPPDDALSDRTLTTVRHVEVPPWSADEFRVISTESKGLANVLRNAPQKLRDLALVPFNTRLIANLLAEEGIGQRLREVSSQSQLLGLYWSHRVDHHGPAATLCVFEVVKAMLRARMLRVPFIDAVGNPELFDTMCSEGILVERNQQAVQFRHHILFDYAAAKFLLASGDALGGTSNLGRSESSGLLLAPAIRLAMRDRWERSPDRTAFWRLFETLVLDDQIDPVIRSAAARVGAEFPSAERDIQWFIDQLSLDREGASAALAKLCRSVAVLFEDERGRSVTPWAWLVGAIADYAERVPESIRILLDSVIVANVDERLKNGIGRAARALLSFYQGLDGTPFAIRTAVAHVADSYATDAGESRKLLSRVFETERFDRVGFFEVPAVCSKVSSIAAVDPEFVEEIYRQTYALEVTSDAQTMMSGSEILPLMSNAQQDFDMARYELAEYFETLLRSMPETAVMALTEALEGYVRREQKLPAEAGLHVWRVHNREVKLQEDLSYIWAHDPEEAHGHDANALVVTLTKVLKGCETPLAGRIAEGLIDRASLGVLWARLFQTAAARKDGLLQRVLPYAIEMPFLLISDTRKDAIDVIAAGYDGLSRHVKERFETRALALDFPRSLDPERTRSAVLQTLFSSIGLDQLVSIAAMTWARSELEGQETPNERPFRIVSGWLPNETEEIAQSGEDAAEDREVSLAEARIRHAKGLLRLTSKDEDGYSGGFSEACRALEGVADALEEREYSAEVVQQGESTIADGCLVLVNQKLLPSPNDREGTKQFLDLVSVACKSNSPTVDEKTEEAFERMPAWGVPAVRVVAGEIVLGAVIQRAELFDDLSGWIDTLLTDRHPAVRMSVGRRLTALWNADRVAFWSRIETRLQEETNSGVLTSLLVDVIGRVSDDSPQSTERLVLGLAARLPALRDEGDRLREAIARRIAITAVKHQGAGARSLLDGWTSDPANHERELVCVIGTIRDAYTWGLLEGGTDEENAIRSRALGIAQAIAFSAKAALDAATTDGGELDTGRSLARIIDSVCSQLYFSTGARAGSGRDGDYADERLRNFLPEAAPILETIADCAVPHSTYQLINLLEYLMPLDPAMVFDLLARALLSAGDDGRFKYESMGADIVVRVVGRLLADHRSVFENEQRREMLIRCLEGFVEVGWPSARRLMYELPEMFH